MHRLSLQLKSAIEASGYTRTQICERCEIEPAALSKYINGKMHPRKQVITRLLRIIPDDHMAPLCAAYLLDCLPDGVEQYLTITENNQDHATLHDSNSAYAAHTPLPQELENAFDYLRSMAAKSPVIADSILSTYRLMQGIDLDKLD